MQIPLNRKQAGSTLPLAYGGESYGENMAKHRPLPPNATGQS